MLGFHILGDLDLKNDGGMILSLFVPPLVLALVDLSDLSILVVNGWRPLGLLAVLKFVVLFEHTVLFTPVLFFFIPLFLLQVALSSELLRVPVWIVRALFVCQNLLLNGLPRGYSQLGLQLFQVLLGFQPPGLGYLIAIKSSQVDQSGYNVVLPWWPIGTWVT